MTTRASGIGLATVAARGLGDGKVLVRETVATIRQLRDEHRAKHDQWWAGEQVCPHDGRLPPASGTPAHLTSRAAAARRS